MPKKRKGFTEAALRECCIQFYLHLQNRELTTETMARETLRSIYAEFRPPKYPCFGTLVYRMKRLKLVYSRNKETLSFLCKIPTDEDGNPSGRFQCFTDQHFLRNKQNSSVPDGQFSCLICNVSCESKDEYIKHREENILKHKLNCYKLKLQHDIPLLVKDKGNICIKVLDFPFDEKDGLATVNLECDEQKHVIFRIQNKVGQDSTIFLAVECLQFDTLCELSDKMGVSSLKSTAIITPGEMYDLQVTCNASEPTEVKVPIFFQFKKGEEHIKILRFLHIIAGNALTKELAPTSQYTPAPKVYSQYSLDFIPGRRPLKSKRHQLRNVRSLKEYEIPFKVRNLIQYMMKQSPSRTIKEILELDYEFLFLGTPLMIENHKDLFSLLLHIEELQMEVDIRSYNMIDAHLERVKDNPNSLLALKVPGLAEHRPSILKNDNLYCTKGSSKQEYEGVVHDVRESEVWLGFDKRFHSDYIDGEVCNVRFTFNRHPLRLQHRAVELAETLQLDNVLFPDGELTRDRSLREPLKLYNRLLEDNPQQLKAVEMIACDCSGPNPYIIHGPPGTGKTVTLVEAMKQVAKRDPDCHILACAPSNTAADLIAERLLHHVQPGKMFRMFAMSRPAITIKDDIKKISNYDDYNRTFYYPSKEDLMGYQIIITTLTTAGRLAGASFPTKHFTHVFIDEAGQAIEPEALIAVAGILDCTPDTSTGHLILAGDPKQLGPIIRSPLARSYHLDMSLMERLMLKCKAYKRDLASDEDYDDHLITKLLQNYRSHPAILKVPNELFYENELKVCADKGITHALCRWEELPKQGFPVIFHTVLGKDEREAQSPSFFNTSEVNEVVKYVELLLTARGAGVAIKPADIGIISPYNRQVRKIRQGLKTLQKKLSGTNKDATEIMVGSTEMFQGQERLVIIISTVRSDTDLLKVDFKFHLGFVRNPKRFNVAMTRAKALLIVVGNPHILSIDPRWRKFIQHCYDNGSMKGARFEPLKDFEKVIDQLERFGIGDDMDIPNMDESNFLAQHKEEQQWKRNE